MNPHHLAMPEWMFRWVWRRHAAPPSTLMASRVEVCPPQIWPSSLGWRANLRRWFGLQRWWPAAARPVNRLTAAKGEFLMQLADLPGEDPRLLAERIARARSLRELWHLRMATYGAVACATNQAEAERRLAELNRHFPTRTARTTAFSSALAEPAATTSLPIRPFALHRLQPVAASPDADTGHGPAAANKGPAATAAEVLARYRGLQAVPGTGRTAAPGTLPGRHPAPAVDSADAHRAEAPTIPAPL